MIRYRHLTPSGWFGGSGLRQNRRKGAGSRGLRATDREARTRPALFCTESAERHRDRLRGLARPVGGPAYRRRIPPQRKPTLRLATATDRLARRRVTRTL
jgi:hypothetical protein